MISYLIFVYLFAFASCEAFHANQHLPVQKYQPASQYQPAYPQYIPIYTQPSKSNYNPQLSPNQIEDLQRQYQQWQIGLPPASQSGQAPQPGQAPPQQGQVAGQPGVIWISAPQYSWYPPPPNSNYPPQQYPPPPNQVPYPPGPPGSAPPSEGGNAAANPSSTRQTGTTPFNSTSAVSQPGFETSSTYPPTDESANSSSTSEPYPPSSESSSAYPPSTEIPSSTYIPSTESSSYYPPTTSPSSSTSTSYPPETEKPSTQEPYPPSSSTEYPPQNATTTTTYKPEQNGTANGTNNNPLLKYCKEPRGQFASDDCHKFINCWDEVAVEQECPNALVFNEEKHYCDYPYNVDCGNRTSGSNSTAPGNGTDGYPPINPACPESYGTYRNRSNCAAFYVCVSGEPVDFICPPGTAYSDDLKVCDYPYRVNCKGAPSIPAEQQNANETSSNSTSSSSSSSSNNSSSSSTLSSISTSTNYPPSSTSDSSSPPYPPPPSSTTAEYPPSSTITVAPAPVTESEGPAVPPPGVDPVGYYNNYNLKKLPESIVNTGVRCYHSNVFRLTPDCSSVTVCQDGLTYIVNCGSATSFDAYEQRCVPSFRARC